MCLSKTAGLWILFFIFFYCHLFNSIEILFFFFSSCLDLLCRRTGYGFEASAIDGGVNDAYHLEANEAKSIQLITFWWEVYGQQRDEVTDSRTGSGVEVKRGRESACKLKDPLLLSFGNRKFVFEGITLNQLPDIELCKYVQLYSVE